MNLWVSCKKPQLGSLANMSDSEATPEPEFEADSLPNFGNKLISDPTTDFAEQSQLTYLIPSETNLDLESAFRDLEPGKSILDSLERRDALFFGELSAAPLVLDTLSLTLVTR